MPILDKRYRGSVQLLRLLDLMYRMHTLTRNQYVLISSRVGNRIW